MTHELGDTLLEDQHRVAVAVAVEMIALVDCFFIGPAYRLDADEG